MLLSLSHTGRELEAPQAALSQWLTCAGVPKALLPCPRVRTSSKIETEMGSKKFYFLFVTDQPYTSDLEQLIKILVIIPYNLLYKVLLTLIHVNAC